MPNTILKADRETAAELAKIAELGLDWRRGSRSLTFTAAAASAATPDPSICRL
jgi:hypothetical protein